MLTERPKGDFTFLGAGSLSLGCRAQPGFEVIHATFRPLPSLQKGYDLVEQHLRNIGRPIEALCGMELRMPQPSLPGTFAEFNKSYADKLASWGLFMNTVLPTTRTNVALEVHPVEEPSLFGFYYTQPAKHNRRTFVLSGVADIRRTSEKAEIIAQGDVSQQGLGQKAWYVLQTLEARMQELEVSWKEVTAIDLYTVRDVHHLIGSVLLSGFEDAGHQGIRWHFARPPTVDLEFEMDARCVFNELVLPT